MGGAPSPSPLPSNCSSTRPLAVSPGGGQGLPLRRFHRHLPGLLKFEPGCRQRHPELGNPPQFTIPPPPPLPPPATTPLPVLTSTMHYLFVATNNKLSREEFRIGNKLNAVAKV